MGNIKKDEENFVKVVFLLVEVGTEVLQNILREKIPTPTVKEYFQREEVKNKIKELKKDGQLQKFQFDSLTAEEVSENDFDISLLASVLLLICLPDDDFFPEGRKQKRYIPLKDDQSLGADINRLRLKRNKLWAHVRRAHMPNDFFHSNWKEIVELLHKLSKHDGNIKEHIKKIDNLKLSCDIGKKTTKYIGSLQKWAESDEPSAWIIYDNAKYNYKRSEVQKKALKFTELLAEKLKAFGISNIYYHDKDAQPGMNVFDELNLLVQHATYVLFVCTENFDKNSWSNHYLRTAFYSKMDRGEVENVIAIGYDNEDIPNMFLTFNTLMFLSRMKKEDKEETWKKLRRKFISDGTVVEDLKYTEDSNHTARGLPYTHAVDEPCSGAACLMQGEISNTDKRIRQPSSSQENPGQVKNEKQRKSSSDSIKSMYLENLFFENNGNQVDVSDSNDGPQESEQQSPDSPASGSSVAHSAISGTSATEENADFGVQQPLWDASSGADTALVIMSSEQEDVPEKAAMMPSEEEMLKILSSKYTFTPLTPPKPPDEWKIKDVAGLFGGATCKMQEGTSNMGETVVQPSPSLLPEDHNSVKQGQSQPIPEGLQNSRPVPPLAGDTTSRAGNPDVEADGPENPGTVLEPVEPQRTDFENDGKQENGPDATDSPCESEQQSLDSPPSGSSVANSAMSGENSDSDAQQPYEDVSSRPVASWVPSGVRNILTTVIHVATRPELAYNSMQ